MVDRVDDQGGRGRGDAAGATVVRGAPEDPVERFRPLPLPAWERRSQGYRDIHYDVAEGLVKLTIARPEVRNAFRPQTLFELADGFNRARDDPSVGAVILTGEGPDAFCSGGDQRIRGDDGYLVMTPWLTRASAVSTSSTCRYRSAAFPSRWWPWWPAMPSGAATCCTSSAT